MPKLSIHWKSDAQSNWRSNINLLERISLAGIESLEFQKWLQDYVNAKYASVERQVKVSAKEKSDWTLNVMNCGHL